jgi:hypothetical protein
MVEAVEAMEVGKAWSEVKEFPLKGSSGSVSQTPYAPEEATGIDFCYRNDISS